MVIRVSLNEVEIIPRRCRVGTAHQPYFTAIHRLSNSYRHSWRQVALAMMEEAIIEK